MDVNNTERPNNLKVVSNGISLQGWTVLYDILRDYIKTEAMPQKRKKKTQRLWKAQVVRGLRKRNNTNYLGKKPG